MTKLLLLLAFAAAVQAVAASDPLSTVMARKSEWLRKAEASIPRLLTSEVKPVGVVKIVKDATAFQNALAVAGGTLEDLASRRLGPGDSFVLDFGEHLVGRLSLRLGDLRLQALVNYETYRNFEVVKRCLLTVLADGSARKPRTPYGCHYLVEALYRSGLRAEADKTLLQYWGGDD